MDEPLLNKQEVANLIAALKDGEISFSDEEAKNQKNRKRAAMAIDLFNLTKLVGREQTRIPNLDIIIDIFCKIYTTTLTNKLQRTFNVQRNFMETMLYEEFMASKGKSGTIGVFNLPPLPTGALAVFDQKLSFNLLEIMLGASTEIESPTLDRRLTTLELNVIRGPFNDFCPDMVKAFSQVGRIKASLEKLESNARLISITKPDEEVIAVTLQVSVREELGNIHIIFPVTTLDPLREQLKELLKISSQKGSRWREVFTEQLQKLPMTVSAQSGEFTMSVRELLQIKKGDVLEINYDLNQPLKIMVEGCHKFNAIAGTHNENKAVSLIDAVE